MPEESEAPDVVELTRQVYASLNARDFDAVVEKFGPSSVWDVSRWGLGAHAGREAIRRFLQDWFGSLDAYEVQVEELNDLGNGIVLAVVVQLAHRPASRGVLRVRSAPVFLWTQGKIALVTLYPDIEEGRAAAARAAWPSSQRNIDLHGRVVAAIRARDVPQELIDADFYMQSPATPDTDYKYHGAAGLREWATDLFEAFASGVDYRVERILAAGDDFVVAAFSVVGHSIRSQEPLELRWVGVTWFRDGKVTRAIGYTNSLEALKAVGLAQ